MKIRGHEQGFSLVEIVVALAVAVIVIAMGFKAFVDMSRAGRRSIAVSDLEATLISADRFIKRVGRMATIPPAPEPAVQCQKIAAGAGSANDSLECNVDFGSPPGGVTTQVRFTIVDQRLEYQQFIAGNWVRQTGYPGITGFRVCDFNDLTANTCAIAGAGMNALILLNPANATRFFRYQLTGQPMAPTSSSVAIQLRGAFYARHPLPAAYVGVALQWGG